MLATVASRYGRARALPHRAHARSAVGPGDLAGDPLLDEDCLVLSTVHSAKGQEWDVGVRDQRHRRQLPVRVLDRAAGAVDEERRLLYVAMTRAKELHLIEPLRST